jgi:hypothetical protein
MHVLEVSSEPPEDDDELPPPLELGTVPSGAELLKALYPFEAPLHATMPATKKKLASRCIRRPVPLEAPES